MISKVDSLQEENERLTAELNNAIKFLEEEQDKLSDVKYLKDRIAELESANLDPLKAELEANVKKANLAIILTVVSTLKKYSCTEKF